MRILGREVLEALLPPADVIAAVERAFRESAAGRAAALPRAVLPMGRHGCSWPWSRPCPAWAPSAPSW